MPTLTPNFKFKKPIFEEDTADIRIINENFDIADEEMKDLKESITFLDEKSKEKASTSQLGKIKIGKTLSISDDGTVEINPLLVTPQEMVALVEKYKAKE